MLEDVALTRTQSGKFTLAWDETGDVVFDNRAVYPILTTLVTHKGGYYWDEDVWELSPPGRSKAKLFKSK